jgi:hypothetical protein
MSDEVLARITPSQPRRVLGVGMLVAVGVIAVYVALASPPTLTWVVFLIVTGVAALVLALQMWRATEYAIELTDTELRCTDGQLIAKVLDIEVVDAGFFAFKPSNGFLIRSAVPGSRVWRPGLWWRMGRRIGVGGVTPGAQGKAMSQILASMIAMRTLGGQE